MDILTDLSTPALIRAIKANLYDYFRQLRYASTVDFYEGPELVRWHSPLPHPWFNGVLCTRPAPAEADQLIRETLDYFKARQVHLMTWWLNPGVEKAGWDQYLLPQGFQPDTNTPGMAVDLAALNETLAPPADLTLVPVEDLPHLKTWCRTFLAGFELPPDWEADLFEIMAGMGLNLPMRNYLGYLQGEAVATSSLFLAAGVAGIMCVGTLPDARRRGIGAALTLAPLQEARQMGYRAGILQSSQAGYGVYRQLGFQKLCQIDHYYWANESSS